MTTSDFRPSEGVVVHPYTYQDEGEDCIIGRPETGAFIAIPQEAVGVLEDLRNGLTIGQAQSQYQERHGELPDLDDFLNLLRERGFVSSPRDAAEIQPTQGASSPQPARKFHFVSISSELAGRLFGRPGAAVAVLLSILSVAALVAEPGIVPTRDSLYFEDHKTLNTLFLAVFALTSLFLHELGHLVAARALDVDSRMGIGHRLWILVAETDLTGLWARPRRDRYLPLLAGPAVDVVFGELMVLALVCGRRGWLALTPTAEQMLEALLFITLLRLLWQCFFFVRTDFYYVLANRVRCRNLMGDTEDYLRSKLARLVPAIGTVDQSHLPQRESTAVRWYSLVWLGGRVLALFVLFFVTIPVAVRYFHAVFDAFAAGVAHDSYRFFDALAWTVFSLTPLVIGLFMWFRSIAQGSARGRLRRA